MCRQYPPAHRPGQVHEYLDTLVDWDRAPSSLPPAGHGCLPHEAPPRGCGNHCLPRYLARAWAPALSHDIWRQTTWLRPKTPDLPNTQVRTWYASRPATTSSRDVVALIRAQSRADENCISRIQSHPRQYLVHARTCTAPPFAILPILPDGHTISSKAGQDRPEQELAS